MSKKRLFDHDFTDTSVKPPARQKFYTVRVGGLEGQQLIAEWRDYGKGEGKRWWRHHADDPTQPKVPLPLDGVTHYAAADQADVDEALRREPTVEEHIETAYKAFLPRHDVPPQEMPMVPARRQLNVGDLVERGRTPNHEVMALFNEGRVVILRSPGSRSYEAVPWYLVVKNPVSDTQTRVRDSWALSNAFSGCELIEVLNRYLGGVKINPSYQRGFAWQKEHKDCLLDSLFAGRDLGRVIFISREYPEVDELLDGKQRLTTLVQFYLGELDYNGLYWDELAPSDRRRILRRQIQVANLRGRDLKESDIYGIFLDVNAAGVPQTEEHLVEVRRLHEAALAREAAQAQKAARNGDES